MMAQMENRTSAASRYSCYHSQFQSIQVELAPLVKWIISFSVKWHSNLALKGNEF
jgi:hypothetical protein